jgi:hypothetical protein
MSDGRDRQEPVRPLARFDSPNEIANALDLSREQKIGLLLQWEQDLRQQMTASREGMRPPEPNRAPETLRSVRALLRSLGVADDTL